MEKVKERAQKEKNESEYAMPDATDFFSTVLLLVPFLFKLDFSAKSF